MRLGLRLETPHDEPSVLGSTLDKAQLGTLNPPSATVYEAGGVLRQQSTNEGND